MRLDIVTAFKIFNYGVDYGQLLMEQEFFDDKETICFACGYPKKDDKEKRLYAKVKSVTITYGKYTDLKINNPVFDIEFELIKENL